MSHCPLFLPQLPLRTGPDKKRIPMVYYTASFHSNSTSSSFSVTTPYF